MQFHEDGTMPEDDSIFVFGSNLAGFHGAGAAWAAGRYFKAELGVGQGITGRAYAIPTKGETIKTLPIDEVAINVAVFLAYADSMPDTKFFVTAIGCGLAGYQHSEIAPMFADAPDNCSLPDVWKPFLGYE